MWTCKTCSEEHKDSFSVCWNCGTNQEGEADPGFDTSDEGLRDQLLTCPKCGENSYESQGVANWRCLDCLFDTTYDDPERAYTAPLEMTCNRCQRTMQRGMSEITNESRGDRTVAVETFIPDSEIPSHPLPLLSYYKRQRAYQCECGQKVYW